MRAIAMMAVVAFSAVLAPMTAIAGDPCCPTCCKPYVYYCNSPCHCCETVKQVLEVCHPCTGCKIPIEVCLPVCCTGEPCVYYRRTLFASGENTYQWNCGHGVKVRYLKCGDVKVAYF